MLKILGLPAFLDNYIWFLWDTDTRAVVVVDPGMAQPVLSALTHYDSQLIAILITHHHQDHTGGVLDLLQHFSVPVYGPDESIPFVTHTLTEGDRVPFKALQTTFQVLDIPGHTRGHIGYVNEECVFAGDTLFTGGCGRLFEGTPHMMWHTLQKFSRLPSHLSLYCGHEYTQQNLQFAYEVEPHNHDLLQRMQHTNTLRNNNQPTVPSTLLLEQKTNPFLRTHITSVKNAAEKYCQRTLSDPVEIFAVLREWKNHFNHKQNT